MDDIPDGSADSTLRSQLDVLILVVAVVGAGLLAGGVAKLFGSVFCLGIVVITLYRLARREFGRNRR